VKVKESRMRIDVSSHEIVSITINYKIHQKYSPASALYSLPRFIKWGSGLDCNTQDMFSFRHSFPTMRLQDSIPQVYDKWGRGYIHAWTEKNDFSEQPSPSST